MMKHRYHEHLFSSWLEKAEAAVFLPRQHSIDRAEALAFGPTGHPWVRSDSNPVHRLRRFLVAELSSFRLWTWSLLALLAVDLTVLGIGIGTMFGLWDPL
jgi:hypothetical protein